MSNDVQEGLTIGAVAARTGISAPALRAWEARFGFPRPQRLAGGHRRYDERDVERILRVSAERTSGRSLEAAIGSVTDRSGGPDLSIYAGLRRRRPDLPVNNLSRRAMLAVSRAIEDECGAQGERALLFGAFQDQAAYRRATARWDELSRTSASAIVFADFPTSQRLERGADQVSLAPTSPLRREWAVICAGERFAACLTGWQRPSSTNGTPQSRRFEAVWSVEPEVVYVAARIALQLARTHAPNLYTETPPPALTFMDPVSLARTATVVTNRIVAHLDR